ncbi:MAG: 30S ribosomal protein S6 [Candidatus Moanabacter tarae]|uniref:Small ribosomal subunit protein bS6 n=1 Tax=Candidatus Moanibacter tarae TaxID=2200854 RepID=A0A2Z4AF51_9BACT|nr:MAG: 30S ribosomal protein S6 [Candidatus Moanabacter tarae]|tara:strand:+ start:34823 stop:35131 length:309 start_codon:yes stop_codon:yes gene_type:complete
MNEILDKRKYRASFILDSRGIETPVETQIEHLTKILESVGGTVEKVDNLGKKDFSRVTEQGHEGDVYLHIYFEGPPTATKELRESLRLDKGVKRVYVERAEV